MARRTRQSWDDIIEQGGYRFGVRYMRDEFMGPPWAEHDGHGPVSDWTTRDKCPGERVLIEDHGSRRYYDVVGAMRLAKRDGWGSAGDEGLSKAAKAAKAVDADFAYLRGWCVDDWEWLSVRVEQIDEDDQPMGPAESLSGVESNGSYHEQVARELVAELLTQIEVDTPDAVLSEN